MKSIAPFVFFLAPLAMMAFAVLWGLWRVVGLAFSRSVPGEIVDWRPVQVDGDVGRPDFDRYVPVVRYRAHDGVLRQTLFRRPYDTPNWPGPAEPLVHYRLWPTVIAEEARAGFWGPPVGIFAVSGLALAGGTFLAMDPTDWAWLRGLGIWPH